MATGRKTAIAACALLWILAGPAGMFLAGCDVPPGGPRTADGKKVEAVTADPNDPAETAAVRNLLGAAGMYEHALKILQAYYVKTGACDQQVWTERELANLANARTWRYEGVEAPAAPSGQSIEGAREASLVEQVVSARGDWQKALADLAQLYEAKGMTFKLALIRNVQRRFDPIRTYNYFLHAEVPPATLRPAEVIPEAEALFERAYKMHRAGKPLPLLTDYNKQRQALLLFRQLVDEYPSSTKIALAAYYIADIYKEYFNENIRAVAWYERAWQWDPNILKPARFQAAALYDLRLAHHGKALALYREVVQHEQFNQSNVNHARRRIEQLTRPRE